MCVELRDRTRDGTGVHEAGRLFRNDGGKFGRDVGVVGRVRMIASRPRSIDRSGFLMDFKSGLPLVSELLSHPVER